MVLKKEIRVLGFDDGPFTKEDTNVLVVGAFFRGGSSLEGVVSTHVAVDGTDSTNKIVAVVNQSKFKPQVQAIFVNGIAFGGFNVLDLRAVHKQTGKPVIAVVRRNPDLKKIMQILKRLGKEDAVAIIEDVWRPESFTINGKKIYVQYRGIEREKVEELLTLTCSRSDIPEPIRIAHIIARGIVLGESKGKA